jgi:hypothetical protein
MRKQLGRAILAAGTVVAALGLAIPAALASGTWTVSGGPNFTGHGTVTLTDVTTKVSFTCTITLAGTVTNQTHSTNTAIGRITTVTLSNCTGPPGSTVTGSGTMGTINASSYSGGVTTGTITNVDLVLAITSILGRCTAAVKGTAGITYTNSSGLLRFTTSGDSLTGAASSCPGISMGDAWTITGSVTLTGSPVNPVQVSQP